MKFIARYLLAATLLLAVSTALLCYYYGQTVTWPLVEYTASCAFLAALWMVVVIWHLPRGRG